MPEVSIYGPFHRFQGKYANDLARFGSSYPLPGFPNAVLPASKMGGHPNRNIYHALGPTVDAYAGKLPEGERGIEFYSFVPPRQGATPHIPQWTESQLSQPGVRLVPDLELLLIPIVITKARD